MPESQKIPWIATGVCLVAFTLATDLLVWPVTLDDAFITFRFSEHLAAGDGFGIWNRNEAPVEGFTCLLWMVVLSLAKLFGVQPAIGAKVLGMLSHAGLTAGLFFLPSLARRLAVAEPFLTERWGATTVAAVLSAISAASPWYAATGMEAMPFAALGATALLLPYLTSRVPLVVLVHVLLVLMRPEGLLVALGTSLFHGWLDATGRREGRIALVAALVTFGLLTVFRLFYFGYPLPNTYYAKAAGSAAGLRLRFGVWYVSGFGVAHWPWLLTIGAGLSWSWWRGEGTRERRLSSALALALTAYAAYVAIIGGDNPWAFPMWRHFVHVAPFFWLAVGIAVSSALAGAWSRVAVAVGLSVFATRAEIRAAPAPIGFGFLPYLAVFPSIQLRPPSRIAVWMRHLARSGDVIASPVAGELPYVVDAVHIDMLGLCDAHIAHHGTFDPAGPLDSKSDMAYVIGRRPDIIDGYVSALAIRGRKPRAAIVTRRRAMVDRMLDDPVFERDYCFVVNAPYAPYPQTDRAIFLRWDYFRSRAEVEGVQCIPLKDTTLLAQ